MDEGVLYVTRAGDGVVSWHLTDAAGGSVASDGGRGVPDIGTAFDLALIRFGFDPPLDIDRDETVVTLTAEGSVTLRRESE